MIGTALLCIAMTGQILTQDIPNPGDQVAISGFAREGVPGWSELDFIVSARNKSVPDGTLAIFRSRHPAPTGRYVDSVQLAKTGQTFVCDSQFVWVVKDIEQAKQVDRDVTEAVAKIYFSPHFGKPRQQNAAINREQEKALSEIMRAHSIEMDELLVIGQIAITNEWDAKQKAQEVKHQAWKKQCESQARGLFAIGRALEKAGKKKEALRTYQELIAKYPLSYQAGEALERIEDLTEELTP